MLILKPVLLLIVNCTGFCCCCCGCYSALISTTFAFIIQCFQNLLVSLYRRRKARLARQSKNRPELIGYDHLPRTFWKNDYPIVLVHGFCGWAPDEGPLWGDYWKYLSDPSVAKHHMCYQADLGPL